LSSPFGATHLLHRPYNNIRTLFTMSFANATSKSSATTVYQAVLLDLGSSSEADDNHNNSDLKESLLPPSPTDGKKDDHESPSAFLLLFTGSFLGVVAAILGLLWLGNSPSTVLSNQEKSSFAVFWFALAWSSATAFTAYTVFSIMARSFGRSKEREEGDYNDQNRDNSSDGNEQNCEYKFALGVFLGFCATCTVHDATHGVPITSLLFTAGLAAFWGLLMTCTVRKGSAPAPKERQGTKLPMPAFIV